MRKLFLLLLMVTLLACGAVGTPSTPSTKALAPAFTLVSESPVVTHGPSGTWDGRFTDPGAVLYYDGQFHMFRNGFSQWPGRVGVAYLTSPDGKVWTAVSDGPLFDADDVPYAEFAVLASSALVEDGQWVLYFHTWDSTSSVGPSRIGRATAPAPEGPWTVDPEPILVPRPPGAWDEFAVNAPNVIKTADGYLMYYTGAQQRAVSRQIGLARSEDGLTWTKYDNPDSVEPPFAESDPLLVAGASRTWDEGSLFQPRVVQTETGWLMAFRGNNFYQAHGYGLATSRDGLAWTKYLGNPIIVPEDLPGGRGAFQSALLAHDDRYYLFSEMSKGQGTDIYLFTHEGTIWE